MKKFQRTPNNHDVSMKDYISSFIEKSVINHTENYIKSSSFEEMI